MFDVSPGGGGQFKTVVGDHQPQQQPPAVSHRDPFDMSPFAVHAPDTVLSGGSNTGWAAAAGDKNKPQYLRTEVWFHSPISRKDAESLLVHVSLCKHEIA